MKIGFDAKRYYHNNTGLGNYSRTLVGDLQSLFPENEYKLYDAKSFERTFRLGNKARKEGCQLFHGLSNELPMDIKIPSIVTIHDVCWRTFPEMYHFFDRHIYDWKYGKSCLRADKVVAISESTKRDIMRIYGVKEEKIEVIFQPVARNYYTPLNDSRRIIDENIKDIPKDFILYVGSINRRKNLLSVVKAIEIIPEEQRPLLLVVGNGHEYRREVENYITSHKLGNYVKMVNSVNDNIVLQALYAEAKLFIYPSFYEGFGLPVVEAALQKTPVITSTASSLPEASGADACLIDPYSKDAAEQMAHYIGRLLDDKAFHDSVGTKMEAYAREHFDPEKQARKMMELYESLV